LRDACNGKCERGDVRSKALARIPDFAVETAEQIEVAL
jgi:hypothetical protein